MRKGGHLVVALFYAQGWQGAALFRMSNVWM